jgi:hypothetical protein
MPGGMPPGAPGATGPGGIGPGGTIGPAPMGGSAIAVWKSDGIGSWRMTAASVIPIADPRTPKTGFISPTCGGTGSTAPWAIVLRSARSASPTLNFHTRAWRDLGTRRSSSKRSLAPWSDRSMAAMTSEHLRAIDDAHLVRIGQHCEQALHLGVRDGIIVESRRRLNSKPASASLLALWWLAT